ncbi:hypothetical protein AAEX28_12225 [Lentisphaerota bacterium WC36G]|nr:hypothetical protein LJT99_15055 [Lentisphaerae bacterium WC36]
MKKHLNFLLVTFCFLLIGLLFLIKLNFEKKIFSETEYVKRQNYNQIIEFQYYIKYGKKIKHGYYSKVNFPRKHNKLQLLGYSEFGGYIHGKKDGQWIILANNLKFLQIYENGKMLIWRTFNKAGKLVSKCDFKNGLPYNGDILSFEATAKGVTYWMQVYKKGKTVEEYRYPKDAYY